MPRKMVPVVDAHSTKTEEMASLAKMAQCAGRNSYLSSLFTPQFLEWVKGRMDMDFAPDIMEICRHKDEMRAQLRGELSRVHQELANADRKAGWAAQNVQDRHQQELAKMEGRLNRWRQSVDRWRDEAQAARARAEAYRSALTLVWGLLEDMIAKRDEAERDTEETKLKAFAMLEKALLPTVQEKSE